ncbi:hypothetical protein D3C77_644420 [compost metagenome]
MFVGDEGGHHGAVGGVHHLVQVGEALVVAFGQQARLFEDLRLAGRRADLEGVALEARGVLYVHGALGDQAHDLVVQPVDVGAHLGQVGAQGLVGGVGVFAQRCAVGVGFLHGRAHRH